MSLQMIRWAAAVFSGGSGFIFMCLSAYFLFGDPWISLVVLLMAIQCFVLCWGWVIEILEAK